MGKRALQWLTLVAVLTLAAACGGGGGSADNLLSQVEEEGVLTVSTDPAYPPQSSLNESTGEYEGFDIDVATEIATEWG